MPFIFSVDSSLTKKRDTVIAEVNFTRAEWEHNRKSQFENCRPDWQQLTWFLSIWSEILRICVWINRLLAGLLAVNLMGLSAFAETKGSKTGLPLPRFVSLKSKAVNLRVGPGRQYKVEWLYVSTGLPMEIIEEFDQWRQVRDADGTQGWVFHSLLSGKRTAIVAPWDKQNKNRFISAHKQRDPASDVTAKLQAGVVVVVTDCASGWCGVVVNGVEAYVPQPALWGVYPEENIKS